MASPAVVGTPAETAISTASLSHVVNLPAGATGNLLVAIMNKGAAAAAVSALTGWTELLDENQANGLYIAYRVCDGTEGATTTFTLTGTATRGAWIVYEVSGHEAPGTQAPQIGTTASGSSVSPNPPSVSVTGGSKDILAIACFGRDGEEADDDTWVTAAPTSYTNLLQKACGVAGTALGGMIATAIRQVTTATEDPAVFTCATGAWRAQTIVIHPSTAVQRLEQYAYRGYADDAALGSATAKAAQNTTWEQDTDLNFRVRIGVEEDGGVAYNNYLILSRRLNTGSFARVDAASTIVRSFASPHAADGDAIATGSFVLTGQSAAAATAGQFDETDGATSAPITLNNQYMELEFCVQIRSVDVTDGDTVQLRVQRTGTPLDSYLATVTITVNVPSGVEYTDSDTVPLILTPSATEEHTTFDSDTVLLKLTPSGIEQALPELTLSGDPTFSGSACEVSGTERATAPASILSEVQGWLAFRVRPNWPSTTPPGGGVAPRLFDSNVANGLLAYYTTGSGGCWVVEANGGGTFVAFIVDSFAADTDKTIILAWAGSTLYVSVDGSAFVTGPMGAAAPTPTSWDIGNRANAGRPFEGDFHWVAGGSGTLSDANAPTIHAIGNTDPTFAALPGSPTFLWPADSAHYHTQASSGVETTDSGTANLLFTISATEEHTTFDADTAALRFTPNSVEEHTTFDSGTALLKFTPSAIELLAKEYLDAAIALLMFTPSATEEHTTYDSTEVRLSFTPSGIDERTQFDIGTGQIRFTPSSTDTAQFVDASVVPLLLVPSGTDVYTPLGEIDYIDSGTASLRFTLSATEEHTTFDSATASLQFTVSALEERQMYDTATALLTLSASGTEEHTTFDSASVRVSLTPSALEEYTRLDTGTAKVTFTPSASELASFVDSSTIRLSLFPGTTEVFAGTDTATPVVVLTPGGADTYVSGSNEDADTVILRLTVHTVSDIYYFFDALLVGTLSRRWDATLQRRWQTPLFTNKWSAIMLNRKWSGVLGDTRWSATMVATSKWSGTLVRKWTAIYKGRGEP